VLTLLTNWVKGAVLAVQEYVQLQVATIRGVFSRPFYFHDVVEQFDAIEVTALLDDRTVAIDKYGRRQRITHRGCPLGNWR